MKKLILLFVLGSMLCGCNPPGEDKAFTFEAVVESSLETEAPKATTTTEQTVQASVFVHVCGAVVNPGVYELPAGSRAYEAVLMAGGVTDEAAGYMVNLAEQLQDGEKLYIPEEGESIAINSMQVGDGSPVNGAKININTAPKEDLMLLTGIGSTKAQAIIDYREKVGPFTSIEQIMQVDGIKEAAYEKIKDSIMI